MKASETNLSNRLELIKALYSKKHKKRNSKNVAYIVLTHAPILFKLVKQFQPAQGFTVKKDSFPGGYCCSFETVCRDNESAQVINGITAKYMCSF